MLFQNVFDLVCFPYLVLRIHVKSVTIYNTVAITIFHCNVFVHIKFVSGQKDVCTIYSGKVLSGSLVTILDIYLFQLFTLGV